MIWIDHQPLIGGGLMIWYMEDTGETKVKII
jgi:hypothetical protein